MKKSLQCFLTVLIGIALIISVSPTAYAQETKPDAKMEFTLDEIVVTAERRESTAQDTPVAVSAWDETSIDEQNIGGAQDLTMRMPSTYVTAASVTIRGVGRTSGSLGTEPGVGIFLDGFYNQEGATYLADMYDVERIENVRGPQSTLYGRATIGGAINIITRKPTKEWSGQLKSTIGNYEKREFHTAFGGPTGIENLYYRLRLSDTYYGGHQKNILFKDEYQGTDDKWRVSAKLLYEPMDNLSFYFAYDISDIKERPAATALQDEWPKQGVPKAQSDYRPYSYFKNPYYNWATDAPAGYPTSNPTLRDHYKVANNYPGKHGLDKTEVSLTTDFDMGNLAVKLLSAYRDWHDTSLTDYDDGPMPASYASKLYETTIATYEWSQEVQVLYGGEDIPIKFIGGLYYYDRNRDGTAYSEYFGSKLLEPTTAGQTGRPFLAPNNSVYTTRSLIHDISEAIYGQINYELTDTLTLSTGIRYAIDMKKGKEYNYRQYGPTAAVVDITAPPGEHETFVPFIYAIPTASRPIFGWYRYLYDLSPAYRTPAYVALIARLYNKDGLIIAPVHKGNWEAITYTFGMDYKPMEDTLLFGKYARGYKPGGFVLGSFQEQDFDEETVNAYEVGWKQTWMANRFSTNIGTFYYDYKDLQMSGNEGNVSFVTNASDAKVYGVEVDAQGFIIDNLLTSLTYSYLHTEFGDYPHQYDIPHVPTPLNSTSAYAGADVIGSWVWNPGYVSSLGTVGRYETNLESGEMPYAPQHKVSINATYTLPTDVGDFSWHALYFWQGEVFMSKFNHEDYKADAYDRVDTELMWNSPAYVWRVTLWLKNIFDADTIVSQGMGEGSTGYARTATYIPPMTFGFDVSFKW